MKMKKFFLFLTTMFASVLLAFGVAACKGCGDDECKHKDTEVRVTATCTVDGFKETVCKKCSTVVAQEAVKALGHDKRETVVGATCTTYGTVVEKCVREGCSYEVETEEQALGHTWVNAAGAVAAVCEDRHCTVCQATLIATAAHTYEPSEELSTAATCKAEGSEVYVCTVCHGAQYTETVDKIDHNTAAATWTLGTPQKQEGAATCTYLRADTTTCPDCNETVTRTVDLTHNYVWTVVQTADCTTSGSKALICAGCGEQNEEVAPISYSVGHTWNEGTCTTCSKTQVTKSETTAPVSKAELAGSEIKLPTAAITMPSNYVDTLDDGASMELGATSLNKDDITLSEEDAAKLGDAPIYNLTLTVGGTPETSFGEDNYVTVTIPYTLQPGEDPENIVVAYINESGEITYVEGGEYNDGYVTFQTNHFSYYSVSRLAGPELCEKKYGGHLYVHSVKAPSCTTFGYDIHICTRCGSYQEGGRPAILPTGHDWEFESSGVASTCTTNGTATYKCATCGVTASRVTPATGHVWETTQHTKATCQASGSISQKCKNCAVTYTETLAQLPHSYTHEVVSPTCTQEGYTISTCRDCQKQKKGSIVPAKGHTWNISAPTCGEGQVCLECNANGLPATGAHQYNDKKICTICGSGCKHTYAVTEEVKATCTKNGYKIEKCNLCGNEVKTVTKATGHNYEGNSIKCAVCGSTYVDMKSMLENLLTDGYSMILSDVAVTVTMTETEKDEEGTVLDMTVSTMQMTYEAGEAYLAVKQDSEGKNVITLYMNASVTMKSSADPGDNGTGTAEIYGDGEYIYVTVSFQSNDPNLSKETNTIRISYQSYLDEMSDMYGDMYGGGVTEDSSMGGIGGNVSPDYDVEIDKVSVASSEYMPSGEMTVEEMLSQLLAIEEVEQLVNMLQSRSDVVYDMLGNVFTAAFDGAKKADGTGYVYTLNTAKFVELNNDLYSLTFEELIDKYVGATAFDDIGAYLKGLETKTIKQFATEVFDFTDANGFSSDTIIAAFEALLNMETPEGSPKITINSYLDDPKLGGLTISQLFDIAMSSFGDDYGDGEYEGDYGDMGQSGIAKPVDEALEGSTMTYIDVINNALQICQTMKLVDLIPAESGALETVQQVLETCNTVLGKVSVTITTNNSMGIESVVAKLDHLNVDEFFTLTEYGEETVYEEKTGIAANAGVTVNFGRVTIPEKASLVKTTFEGKYSKIVAGVKKALQQTEDGMIISSGLGNYYAYPSILRLNNGVVECYQLKTSGGFESLEEFFANTEPTIADISKAAIVDLYQGCLGSDSWVVVLDSMNGYYSTDILVNLKTSEIALDFESPLDVLNLVGCNMVEFVPTTLPEGVKLSREEVDCEEHWYTYYKCTNKGCNRVHRISHWKWHDYHDVYKLASGSTTCLDGIIDEYKCSACGYVAYTSTYYHHEQNQVEPFVFALPHGNITVSKYACPCGGHVSYDTYDLWSNDNACIFDGNNGEYVDSLTGVTGASSIYKYTCIDSGELTGNGPCGYYLLKITYTRVSAATATQPCRYLDKTEYRVYNGENVQVGTSLIINSYDESHNTVDTEYGYKCETAGCQYEYYSKTTVDAYGRTTEDLDYWKNGDGSYSSYQKIRYEYDANCNYIRYGTKGHPNNEERKYSNGTHHVWGEPANNAHVCVACGATEYKYQMQDAYGRITMYEHYIRTAAGEYLYYEKRTYTYNGCDYTCGAIYGNPNNDISDTYTGTRHVGEEVQHVAPTCTQPGRWKTVCMICEEDGTLAGWGDCGYWYYDADHRWIEDGNGGYVCQDCGLESEQEGSNIVLEDLTNHETYGADGYYTIGFRENWGEWCWAYGYGTPGYTVNFTFVDVATGEIVLDQTEQPVSVVPEWTFASGFDAVFSDYYYWNGWRLYNNNMIRFSVADIDAAATNAGIDLSSGNYALRIQFLPIGGASQYADMFYLTDFVSAQ